MGQHRNPFREILSSVPDDRPGVHLTRDQLESWAGRALSDEEVDALDMRIPDSSIPEAIQTMIDNPY